jgi:pyruvate/2-oxoglutarate dehydrogenase complex dihydrolipoamide acyltransferase (E2) component
MATEVRLPQWGMGMVDGEIVVWLKEVGDHVDLGEGLVEVETSKVVEILESPVSGTLVRQVAEVGDVVPVRDVVAIIDEGAESGE